jgi:hypothetical protein
VVEALDILQEADMASLLSHKIDNYMKIMRRNDLYYPGRWDVYLFYDTDTVYHFSYPAEQMYTMGEDYVSTVPRTMELISR